ncbi:MAG: AAA family ATPase [Bacteroidota bacterium]|nr:AAA family ATPase [Bacteroidota bacterium]
MLQKKIGWFKILIATTLLLASSKSTLASTILHPSATENDSIKTHILTLEYISRKTNNSKYFLSLAQDYCDILIKAKRDSVWAQSFKDKFNLTLSTCNENMNHRVQLFPFFKGFPSYMGFADDVIEYAYDNALENLFNTTFKKIHNGPLSEANISSIVTRKNCDNEMFEIVNQSVIAKTNHFILQQHELEDILGIEKTKSLINGDTNPELLDKICSELNLEKIGVFNVNNLDSINEKIWLVHSEFKTYSSNGFTEAVFTRGFSQDKRGVMGMNMLILLLESILLISLIALIDEKVIKFIRTKRLFSPKELFFQFVKKVKFVSICFAVPTVLSFAMIYSLNFLTPEPTDHYMESGSILWLIALTVCMSLVPTFTNLFLINRLQLDGFHNRRGYRTFANASLYATYLPLFIFYIAQFEDYPKIAHFLLVILTFVIGDLLARSYFQFTSKTFHKNLKIQAGVGLLAGIIALIFFNTSTLTEISASTFLSSLIFITPISFVHFQIEKLIDTINLKKLDSSKQKTLLGGLNFIYDVISPQNVYDNIANNLSESNLNLMIISAPMGMGKTRTLKEVEQIFRKNDWKWYYGDCDEIQDENTISYEPFIQAFKNLLHQDEFTNRSQFTENISGEVIKKVADISGAGPEIVSQLNIDENLTMTDICVEIAEKLETNKNKTVFIMEDLHWIDPESYAFLKHFIKTINRNEFIRGNLCIILTLRNDEVFNYRGVNYKKLVGDLGELSDNINPNIIIEDILTEKQFNIQDFVNHISNQNEEFKIQDDSLADINYKFNNALLDNQEKLVLTPLYILKVIEQWIQSQVLKYTPNGYVLSCSADSLDLPNTNEIDAYYHSILDGFDNKWTRFLESAAIIGNKFNAEILAKVWGYELLEILDFCELAEQKHLIIDVSEEDNIYKFSNKRIITAIKSYFPGSQEAGVKQIIIEYNKRYLDLHKNIIEDPSEYSIEEILSIIRRLTLIISNPQYDELTKRLIFEVIVRLIVDDEFDKITAFQDFLVNRKYTQLANLIGLVNKVANRNTSFKEVTQIGKLLYEMSYEDNSIEQEFRIYGLMFKQKRFSSGGENNEAVFVNDKELRIIKEKINSTYKGKTLISLSFLYLNCSILNRKEKLLFLEQLNEKLKTSSNFQLFSLYIKHLKISLTLNGDFNQNEIDQKTDFLLRKAILTNELRLIKICLKLRIQIVTKFLKDEEMAIKIFRDFHNVLKTNKKTNVHWVAFVLYFYCNSAGERYCGENPEQMKSDLATCKDFLYKRNDSEDWSELIEDWFNAKKIYLRITNQEDELKAVSERHLKVLSLNKIAIS